MKKVILALGILVLLVNYSFAQLPKFKPQSNTDWWGEGPFNIKGNLSMPRGSGNGIAALDFDGDNLKDIIMPLPFSNVGSDDVMYLRFFKNMNNGTFKEITSNYKNAFNNGKFYIHADDAEPTVFDFNKDGKLDFYYNGLMENNDTRNYDTLYGLVKMKDYFYTNKLNSFEWYQVQGRNSLTFFYQDNGSIKKGDSLFDTKTYGRYYSSNHADINNDGFEDLLINAEGFVVKDSLAKNWFNGILYWINDNGKGFKYNHLSFDDTVAKSLFSITGIGTENGVVSMGDYNGDGYVDIQIYGFKVPYKPREQFQPPNIDSSMWSTNYKIYNRNSAVPETRIYFNNKGKFDSNNYIVLPNFRSTYSYPIDLNGDGKLDFVSCWSNYALRSSPYYLDTVSNKDGINTQFYIGINIGNNTFEDQTLKYFPFDNYKFSRLATRKLKPIDIDNDGYLDLFPTNGLGDSLYSNQAGAYSQDTIGSQATIYYKNFKNQYFKKTIIDSFFVVKEWLNYPILKNLDSMYYKRYISSNPTPRYKGQYLLDQLYLTNKIYIEDFNNDGKIDFLGYTPYDNDLQNFLRPIYNFKYDNTKVGQAFQLIFQCNVKKPIFNTTKYSFCLGDSLKLTVTNINKGDSLRWYFGTKTDITNVSTKTFTDTTKLFVIRTDSLGCNISSDTVSLVKYAIPPTPTLSRDTANNLVSNSSTGNVWYKDDMSISDTAQKIKPTTPGSYRVKTTQNGCVSALSSPYYFLVTDVVNLSANEFIKLTPNPFVNQLNFDFVVKGYQRLNLEVFDIATATKVASKQNQTQGMPIYLGHLSSGTYVIKISSTDNKISYQFKMVKL